MKTTIFFLIFLILLLSGCAKKATVSTYSQVNVPIKNLQYVHLNIEGSDLFTQKLYERIPIMFLDQEILVDDPSSPDILHIIENSLQKKLDIEDSEETKDVKYIREVYNQKTKSYETKTFYLERRYYKRCWIHRFELSSSVTTRYKRDTISATTSQEVCRTNRYNIFYEPNFNYNQSTIYQTLVTNLRDKIINYLVPYRVYYTIELEDDIDIEMENADEDVFELIIEQIDSGVALPSMVDRLEGLLIKYPNSYTILFTIGVLYEIFGENEKALVNYQKALEIQASTKLLQRIQKVKANSFNLEKLGTI